MALEDIKDQLKERWATLLGQIQESPLYNNLREKYETLPPNTQSGIIIGGVLLTLFIVLSIPYSYFESASTASEEYNDKRQLLRELFRAQQMAQDAANVPAPVSAESMKGVIQNTLNTFGLLPEQNGGIVDFEVGGPGQLAPASIQQAGLNVILKKLNLKQIVEIALQLQDTNPSVKLSGLEILAASPDPHYFDVSMKLTVFSMPVAEDTEPAEAAAGPRRGGRPPPASGTAPADEESEDEETE